MILGINRLRSTNTNTNTMVSSSSPSWSVVVTLIILLTTPPPSSALPIPTPSSFHSLISLSHSLLTRVSTLRASRGDVSGSLRAKTIAQNIEKHTRGFSFYGLVFSLTWDYVKNYSWRDVSVHMFGVGSDLKELVVSFAEVSRLESEMERVEWVRRNYGNVLRLCNSLFTRLLKVFTHSGPLKDIVEIVKTEIMDGGLLRDSLELGSGDLKGVIQILKDVALQYSSTGGKTEL